MPTPAPRSGGTYLKLERKVGDFATVARRRHAHPRQRLDRRGRHRPDGASTRRTSMRRDAEASLAGGAPSDDAFAEAGRLAAAAAHPVTDVRGHRDVQTTHDRGLRATRAAPGRSRWRTRAEGGTAMQVTLTVNGTEHDRRRRASAAAGAPDPRGTRAHRHPYRVRHDQLRRVHGAARRHAREVLHPVRGPGRRPLDHDGRGPRWTARVAPDPGRLQGAPRPAVRLLHAGHDAGGGGAARARTRTRATTMSGRRSRATSAAAPAT